MRTRTPSSRQNSNRATSLVIKLAGVLGCGHNHIEQLIIFPLVHISSTLILLLFPCSSQSQTLSPLKGGEGRWRREKVSEQGPQLTHNTSSGFQFYKEGWHQGTFVFQTSPAKWRKGCGGPRGRHHSEAPAWSWLSLTATENHFSDLKSPSLTGIPSNYFFFTIHY